MSFIIYKSSAGSGKTSTLVTEYLTIALANVDGVGFRQILAITFTNKAAFEMKERVLQSLENFAQNNGKDPHVAEAICKKLNWNSEKLKTQSALLLQQMLHHYADISISTIDSFITRLVRTFAYDLNLPFQFKLELNAQELLQESADAVVDEVGKNNPELTSILSEFVLHKTGNEKGKHIEQDLKKRASELLGIGNHDVFEQLEEIQETQYLEVEKQLKKEINQFIQKVRDLAHEVEEYLQQNGLDSSYYPGKSRGAVQAILKLKHFSGNTVSFNSVMLKFALENNWDSKKNLSNEAIEFQNKFKQTVANLIQENASFQLRKAFLNSIYEQAALNLIRSRFEQLKDERNLIPLSSFNELVNKLVLNEPIPFIYERIGEKYKHFLVDEFQDTSTIQWQNLLPLYSNSLASGNFNMVVGDGKQSIYRFRGGDVSQFLNLGKADATNSPALAEHLETVNQNAQTEQLKVNYRSCREIVEFNNAFFSLTANALSEEWRPLYADVEQGFNPKKTGGLVRVKSISKSDYSVDLVKNEVLECVKDIEENTSFKLSDICFLTQKKDQGAKVIEWLQSAGYEVFTLESLLLKNSIEVSAIVRLLAYLNKPFDATTAVAAVAALVECNIPMRSTNLHELFTKTKEKPTQLPQLLRKEGLSSFPETSIGLTLYALCQDLIAALQFEYNAYLSKLANEIAAFEEKNGNNLEMLLDVLEQSILDKSIQAQEADNAIQVLTMHKSKGLQFPIVFIPFGSWSVSPQNKKPFWIPKNESDLELPYSLIKDEATLKGTKLEYHQTKEAALTLLDHLNLLYVAFTRPQYRLYVWANGEQGNFKSIWSLFPRLTGYNEAEGSFTHGDGKASPTQNSTHTEETKINYHRGLHKGKLTLSSSRLKALEDVAKDEQLLGKIFHAYMELVPYKNKLNRATKWLQQQPITSAQITKIESWAQQLFEHKDTAKFFESGVVNYRESKLVANGKNVRADRIVFLQDAVYVLDFKTGEPKPEHVNQIRTYALPVSQTTNQSVKPILIYLDPFIVQEVSFQPTLF